MTLGGRSLLALQGVHPDLVAIIRRASDGGPPFIVTEGLRSKARQAVLVAAGKSRTMNSRHITGHAVDLAVTIPGGGVSWEHEEYRRLAITVKACAAELGIPVQWGGECFGPAFVDAVHWQLPHREYPPDIPDLNPPGQVSHT